MATSGEFVRMHRRILSGMLFKHMSCRRLPQPAGRALARSRWAALPAGSRRAVVRYDEIMSMEPGGSMERTFLAIQRCAVPRCATFTGSQAAESLRIVRHFLAGRPPSVVRKLQLFFVLIDAISIARGGRPFYRLPVEKQKRVLQSLFNSGIPLLRKGFWGLNTLARMSAYGQPSVYPDLAYHLRPTPDERTGS